MDYKKINKKEVNEVLELINLYKNSKIIDNKIKDNLYNRCKSIIDHDKWYTEEDIDIIYENACKLPFFTNKQINSFSYSNILNNNDDEYNYDDGATSDEDRRWCD